jgi:hypothetical protein
LADIAVLDLLQFVHMSQRSGTLLLECNGRRAHISFHRGRIVSAWSPSSLSIVKQLIARGVLSDEQVVQVEAHRRALAPPPSLGQALLDAGLVRHTELRNAVATKIEQAIFELIGWNRGKFQIVAEEVRADDEISFTPGDVVPALEVDTQSILMEAVRLFDERGRDLAAGLAPAPLSAGNDATFGPGHSSDSSALSVPRIQVVSKDNSVTDALAAALAGQALVGSVAVQDAGVPALGELHPIVVVDRRNGQRDVLIRLRELQPRVLSVGLVGAASEIAAAFSDGAAAAAELSYLPACCANLLRARQPGFAPAMQEAGLSAGLARLRRVHGDLRSGLLSATVSLNLMTIVADSVERAVLFVQQRDLLVALGAFGVRQDGSPLAGITRGLALRMDPEGPIAQCIAEGRALSLDYETEPLPAELRVAVDRPRSGQCVFFPVLGSRRSIGLIYADNGRRGGRIQDVELMELATAQVGLAFENELLRRQIGRFLSD